MTCGIYKIMTPSGNCYVGSSHNIKIRWQNHVSCMKLQKHHCTALNHVALKYSIDELEFIILEECARDELLIREQYWFEKLNPVYNSCRTATGPTETNRKLAREHILRLNQIPWTQERKDKARKRLAASEPWTKNKPWTPERRAAQSLRMKKRHQDGTTGLRRGVDQ